MSLAEGVGGGGGRTGKRGDQADKESGWGTIGWAWGCRESTAHAPASCYMRVDVEPATNLAELKPLIGQKRDRENAPIWGGRMCWGIDRSAEISRPACSGSMSGPRPY